MLANTSLLKMQWAIGIVFNSKTILVVKSERNHMFSNYPCTVKSQGFK